MELEHSFTVPAGVDETWATFMDLEKVGSCFPGATVTEASDEAFAGTVKVKLGPIALVYGGTGKFVERDDAAHRAVIEAKGKDKRGNGTAGATVRIALAPAGTGTQVDVTTDLQVTGKPAQFGRGVMQDVSDKLLQQFVGCIEGRLGESSAAPASAEPGAPAEGAGSDDAAVPVVDTPAPATAAATTPVPAPVPAAPLPGTAGGREAGREGRLDRPRGDRPAGAPAHLRRLRRRRAGGRGHRLAHRAWWVLTVRTPCDLDGSRRDPATGAVVATGSSAARARSSSRTRRTSASLRSVPRPAVKVAMRPPLSRDIRRWVRSMSATTGASSAPAAAAVRTVSRISLVNMAQV